jgi:predicted transcriptional regulator
MNDVKNFMLMFGLDKNAMAQLMSVTRNAVSNWLSGANVPKYVLKNIEVFTNKPELMVEWL